MNSSRITQLAGLTVAVIAAVILLSLAVTRAEAGPKRVMAFDIANNMTQFTFDEAPVHENGMPDGGNAFIIHGYIYPEGTLDESENGGVNADGSPEFPDLVLGEWICRGYFIADGTATTSGAWAITTQTFNLGENAGEDMLVTEGYEHSEAGATIQRAVTGGTGVYTGLLGTAIQTTIGVNSTGAPNLRVQISLGQ
jgi:hypothetical protein